MARLARAAAVYHAADLWFKRSIVADSSIFAPSIPFLWTIENITAFKNAFVDNPQEGAETFEQKFAAQLGNQAPEIQMLGAEMLWILLLFARKAVSVERKRQLITTVWEWSGNPHPRAHPLLAEDVLAGIGNAGTAFNTQRDRELEALITFVLALKGVRESLVGMPAFQVADMFDKDPKAARRNIRNILLHLMFPDDFERVASASHKVKIVRAFAKSLPEGTAPVSSPLKAVDLQLRVIRAQLQQAWKDRPVDFYESPWREQWAQEPTPSGGTTKRPARKSKARDETSSGKQPESTIDDDVLPTSQSAAPGAPELRITSGNANDELRAGLWLAQAMASRFEGSQVTPDLLFGAYLALANNEAYGSHTSAAIGRTISAALRRKNPLLGSAADFLAPYNEPLPLIPTPIPDVQPGPLIAPLFRAALAIAMRVMLATPQRLSPRHVLSALLIDGPQSVVPRLTELGLDAAVLRRALLKAVLDWREEEDRDQWRLILEGGQELDWHELVPTPEAVFHAGINNDATATSRITAADDRLDVMKDVTALCEVLAAQQTEPPLAVGLFGDWGTGKSFFMELMRQKIKELGAENPSFYCERVVQVWFNAWHYMDTNLWASLAAEVFEELAHHLESWELPEDQRKKLFDQLQQSQGVLAEAMTEKADAEKRIAAIQQLKEAKEGSIAATAVTAFNAAAAALAADPEVQQKLRDAREQLGLNHAQAVVSEATEQARRLRSVGGRAAALGRVLARRPVFLVLGIAVFAAVTVGVRWLLDHRAGWDGVSSVVSALAAGVAMATAAVAPALRQVSRGVRWIEDVATRLQQRRDAEQRREELEIHRDLMRLDERQREAQARVDALSRDIDEMRAGRRLQRFILERHTSAEYRQHLGLVNLIRNDFERLSTLLSQARKERQDGAKASPASAPADGAPPASELLPQIDRIILYIDDLDRCPEDRVVEVLQAVHLLLAFPLFVVVVGVDSRWLLLSLEDHYAALRGRGGEAGENGKRRDDEWNTTPQNYLEKIFQIPFTLRPMGSAGFGNLVQTLLPAAETTEATGQTNGDVDGRTSVGQAAANPHASTDPAVGAEDDEIDDEPPIEEDDDAGVITDGGEATDEEKKTGEEKKDEPPPVVRANPQGLTVEKWEREFVAQLHPLIASPRALKRFTNVYRFLRVQRRGAELSRFRGTEDEPGEFQVVALLLAVIIGYPADAPRLLRAILTTPDTAWWTLVEQLEEQPVAPAASHVDDGQHGRATLREALQQVQRTVKMADHPPEVVARWAREVARFSFQSGRILSLRDQKGGVGTAGASAGTRA